MRGATAVSPWRAIAARGGMAIATSTTANGAGGAALRSLPGSAAAWQQVSGRKPSQGVSGAADESAGADWQQPCPSPGRGLCDVRARAQGTESEDRGAEDSADGGVTDHDRSISASRQASTGTWTSLDRPIARATGVPTREARARVR